MATKVPSAKQKLTVDQIVVGHVYAAKRPSAVGPFFEPLWNDRQVKWISKDGFYVQYDSPAIRNGGKFPTILLDKFIAWAGADITAEMPEGAWRPAKH